MPKPKTIAQTEEKVFVFGTKGLNLSIPAMLIEDDELSYGINFWLSQLGQFESRPNLVSCLDTVLPASVRGMGYWAAGDQIIAFAGTGVFSMPSDFSTDPVLLGYVSSADSSIPVVTQNYSSKLFIGSGGELQYIDAGGLQTITKAAGSLDPPTATVALAVKSNRLMAGQESTIYYSGAGFYDDWGDAGAAPTLNGGSFSIDMGDGGEISGLANWKEYLIVHKYGTRNTINKVSGTGEDDDYFVPTHVAEGISCVSPELLIPFDADQFFCSNGGVHLFKTVDNLGNTESIPLSSKISPAYTVSAPLAATFSDKYGMYFIVNSIGQILCYNRGAEAWFKWATNLTTMKSAKNIGEKVYFGGEDGQIYRLAIGEYVASPEVFQSALSTKAFSMGATSNAKFVKNAQIVAQFQSEDIVHMEAKGRTGTARLRKRQYSGAGTLSQGFDRSYGFDDTHLGFDMAAKTVNIPFKIARSTDNLMISISTYARVRLIYGIINPHGMTRREVSING